ncbi:MAG: hypothetical protein FJ118_01260 [Deltaproteobacteria bacterium]|nr:hypothetical protein [Deltaproteobacteria bacterium]
MEGEDILLWSSWISAVIWGAVLVWCVASIVIKSRREREWLDKYVSTLQSELDETSVTSWDTLQELQRKKALNQKRGKS